MFHSSMPVNCPDLRKIISRERHGLFLLYDNFIDSDCTGVPDLERFA